jgi:hypothetical protein
MKFLINNQIPDLVPIVQQVMQIQIEKRVREREQGQNCSLGMQVGCTKQWGWVSKQGHRLSSPTRITSRMLELQFSTRGSETIKSTTILLRLPLSRI